MRRANFRYTTCTECGDLFPSDERYDVDDETGTYYACFPDDYLAICDLCCSRYRCAICEDLVEPRSATVFKTDSDSGETYAYCPRCWTDLLLSPEEQHD